MPVRRPERWPGGSDFGLFRLQGLTPRRNVAEEAQGIRLVAAFLVLMGECSVRSARACASSSGQQAAAPLPGRAHRAPEGLLFSSRWSVPSPA